MIPYSVYLPLIGQFLSGFLNLQRPLMVGELARSYTKDQLQTKYSFFTASYGVGSTLGPCVAFMITNADFYIFGLHMTYGNIPGLIRVIQIIISLILTLLYVHDLSKEFDYKNKVQQFNKVREKDGTFLFNVIKELDLLLMFVAAFVINATEAILYVFYPVYIIETLHLSKSIVDLCYILPFLVYPMLTFIMLKSTKNNEVYHFGIIGWILLIVVGLSLLTLNSLFPASVNIAILFGLNFIMQIFAYLMLMFVTVTLSNLVQSKHQSVLDSVRCTCRQAGAFAGSPIGAYGANGKNYIGYGFVLASSIMLFFC